jgi:galactose-1-phosphate uridylyltransferase
LKQELDLIQHVLKNNLPLTDYPELKKHEPWIEKIRDKVLKAFRMDLFLQMEVGRIFEEVIEDCGVFKRTDRKAFIDFVEKACR